MVLWISSIFNAFIDLQSPMPFSINPQVIMLKPKLTRTMISLFMAPPYMSFARFWICLPD